MTNLLSKLILLILKQNFHQGYSFQIFTSIPPPPQKKIKLKWKLRSHQNGGRVFSPVSGDIKNTDL